MPPQLHLIPAEPDARMPSETFRADARLRLWGAAMCAIAAIVFTTLGYGRSLAAYAAAFTAAAFLLWSAYLLATFAGRRAVRYSLTPQRIEIEMGILGKRYESVELWRVRDVVLDQTALERLRGVGRITLYSNDQVEPQLKVGPVADAKALFEKLRDAVAAARKDARVVPLA
jgi:membrane protein YdbS with pleckstrin-like domain